MPSLHVHYTTYIVALLDLKSSILSKVTACPRSPKAVLFRLAKFLLEAMIGGRIKAINLREIPPKSGWVASLDGLLLLYI